MKKLTQILLLQSLCLSAFSADDEAEKDQRDFKRYAEYRWAGQPPATSPQWNEKKKKLDYVQTSNYSTNIESSRHEGGPLNNNGNLNYTNFITLEEISSDGKIVQLRDDRFMSNFNVLEPKQKSRGMGSQGANLRESSRMICEKRYSKMATSGTYIQELIISGGIPSKTPLERPNLRFLLQSKEPRFVTMNIKRGIWKFVDFPKSPEGSRLRINWRVSPKAEPVFVDKNAEAWEEIKGKFSSPVFTLSATGEGATTKKIRFPDRLEELFHATLEYDTKTGERKETKLCDATVFTLLNIGINGKIVIDPTMTKKDPVADNFWEKGTRKMAEAVHSSKTRHEMDGKIYEEFRVDGLGGVFKDEKRGLRPTLKFRVHPDDLVHFKLAPTSGTWTIVDATPHGSKSNVSIDWAGTGDSHIEYVRKEYTTGEEALARLMTWKQPD